jgi:hypothetical protein
MPFSVRLLSKGLCIFAALGVVVYLSRPIWSTYRWWNFPVADIEYLKSFQQKNGLKYECGRQNLVEREVTEDEVRACLRGGIHTNTLIYDAKLAGHEMAVTSFSCSRNDFKATVHYVTFGGSDTIGCEYTVVPSSAEIPPFKIGERAYYPYDGLPNAVASAFISILQSAFPKRYPAEVQAMEK